MVMMASQHMPDKVIRQMVASAINIVVHCARLNDGTRKVVEISEVGDVEHDLVDTAPFSSSSARASARAAR